MKDEKIKEISDLITSKLCKTSDCLMSGCSCDKIRLEAKVLTEKIIDVIERKE